MHSLTANLSDVGRQRVTLGQTFDPGANALNAIRLVLAIGVILWHSYLPTGHDVPFAAVRQLLGEVWVDGFFAISGFLITSSWLRNPRIRDYFIARGLRILPGFYTCLVITACVIAPVGVALQGEPALKLLLSRAPIMYILKNSGVWMYQYDVGGTPRGIPWPGAWNASLWTLGWELLCYIAIAILGVAGLLSRRWLFPAAMALCGLGLVLSVAIGLPRLAHDAARFALMFLAGALLHQFRNAIPARWSLVAMSVIIVLAASLLPDYRLVAGIPLAYAIVVSGALIHNQRFTLRTDLSYGVYIYAFPIQQLLIIVGLGGVNPVVFATIATVATLPLAALSWFLVEKPAMSLKSGLNRWRSAPDREHKAGHAVSSKGRSD
jgi:peptidoglycan/LPS O-acetylase OafA/YrhL